MASFLLTKHGSVVGMETNFLADCQSDHRVSKSMSYFYVYKFILNAYYVKQPKIQWPVGPPPSAIWWSDAKSGGLEPHDHR